MGVWNIGHRQRSLSVFCCGVLRYVANYGVGSQFALYRGSSGGSQPEGRTPGRSVWTSVRRASDGSGSKQSKSPVRHLKRPAPNTAWRKASPAGGRTDLSPELRKLSFEDFPAEREKPARRKEAKDDSDYEVVFGVSPCLLALRQGRRRALRLLVKEGAGPRGAALLQVCEAARARGVQVERVSKKRLDGAAPGSVHQGVCLLASPLGYLPAPTTVEPPGGGGPTPLWLALESIQDPMNLGAILRTAYFLGVDRVASSVRRSCPLTPVVSKASSGAMEVVEVYGYESLEALVQQKAARGWQVVGTVAAEVRERGVPVAPCWDFQVTKPTLLLLGGEGDGLSQTLLSQCHTLLTIPAGRDLVPGVESLNVSVAAGILLHSLLSSRRGGHKTSTIGGHGRFA